GVTQSQVTESQYDWLTGTIYLAHDYESEDQLKHECAHELFHAVQNDYMMTPRMGSRRWWMDATADYAAEKIAWGGRIHTMGKGIDFKYIEAALTYAGASGPIDWADHEYQTAHLIDYLVRRGVNFKEMFDAVMAQSQDPADVIPIINKCVQTATGSTLFDLYREFIRSLLFDPSFLIPEPDPVTHKPKDLYERGASTKSTMGKADTSLPVWKAEMEPDFGAKLWGIKAEIDKAKGNTRTLRVELVDKSGPLTYAEVYVLPENKRAGKIRPDGVLVNKDDIVRASLSAKDALYVLAFSQALGEKQWLSVKVSDDTPMLTITPAEIPNAENKLYNFTARAENMPSTVRGVEFEWDFGDDSDRVSFRPVGGEIKGTAESSASHRFQALRDATVTVRLYDRTTGRPLLAQATAQVIFKDLKAGLSFEEDTVRGELGSELYFRLKVENVPVGATFKWEFGDGSKPVTTPDRAVGHIYANDGKFGVSVEMRDKAGKFLADGRCRALVSVGKKIETSTDNYDSGEPYQTYTFYWKIEDPDDPSDKRQIFHGKRTCWYKNGNKLQDATYVDGYLDGLAIWYNEDGGKHEEVTYKKDIMDGQRIVYQDNGQKLTECIMRDNCQDGTWSSYYENGAQSETKTYKMDVLDGPYTEYFKNGKRRETGQYREGKRDGEWQEWNEEGKLVSQYSLSEDINDGAFATFYANGKPCTKGMYNKREKTGKWIEWFENGKKSEEGAYSEGKRTGDWKEYQTSGELIVERTYREGML
ncbi:MAG: PKD domain-containing protein, partial [Candidatus Eisenbacteria bacterium]